MLLSFMGVYRLRVKAKGVRLAHEGPRFGGFGSDGSALGAAVIFMAAEGVLASKPVATESAGEIPLFFVNLEEKIISHTEG